MCSCKTSTVPSETKYDISALCICKQFITVLAQCPCVAQLSTQPGVILKVLQLWVEVVAPMLSSL